MSNETLNPWSWRKETNKNGFPIAIRKQIISCWWQVKFYLS